MLSQEQIVLERQSYEHISLAVWCGGGTAVSTTDSQLEGNGFDPGNHYFLENLLA